MQHVKRRFADRLAVWTGDDCCDGVLVLLASGWLMRITRSVEGSLRFGKKLDSLVPTTLLV